MSETPQEIIWRLEKQAMAAEARATRAEEDLKRAERILDGKGEGRGTLVYRYEALSDWAEKELGHSPLSSRGVETAIFEAVAELKARLARAEEERDSANAQRDEAAEKSRVHWELGMDWKKQAEAAEKERDEIDGQRLHWLDKYQDGLIEAGQLKELLLEANQSLDRAESRLREVEAERDEANQKAGWATAHRQLDRALLAESHLSEARAKLAELLVEVARHRVFREANANDYSADQALYSLADKLSERDDAA